MKSMPNFIHKPVLEGERALLRPFKEEDLKFILAILDEPELRRLTGSASCDEETNSPLSTEDLERTRHWYESRNEQTDRLDLAIIDKKTGLLVGEAVFNEYDEATGNVNFRILIGQAGQGRGIGSEATKIFLRYGFILLDLHKISLEVFSFNPRAERVYIKNGFVLEGIKREDFRFNEEYIDTKIYGMLKSDFLKTQSEI
ncbi:GNAT family protein [Proteiniclasticum sp.]|uniref:GNAT family N-acetyltransferase n=1 Tax=Proteiniclasticum sp. TaxID=2053595 RepID=UPI00289B4FD5|nr:GNAT family protein [Proteiniclasticum sp.]